MMLLQTGLSRVPVLQARFLFELGRHGALVAAC